VAEGDISGVDRPTPDEPPGRRLTVAQAADVLGISDDAVRSRIKRGTLRAVRESGRVFVVLADKTGSTTRCPSASATWSDRSKRNARHVDALILC
jgi:excisionase family DNA binding protein